MTGRMPEDMPDRMPEDMPDKMPEDMSDRMPEDLPVTKRIDVMVGIIRSKVIFFVVLSQLNRPLVFINPGLTLMFRQTQVRMKTRQESKGKASTA